MNGSRSWSQQRSRGGSGSRLPVESAAPSQASRSVGKRSATRNRAARQALPAMDISWRDLANVEQPGDYPFRDGEIAVTFAEIAIWKNHPDARFQLMRKYPLQTQARYALGKQSDEGPLPEADQAPFYTSSNGDSWS